MEWDYFHTIQKIVLKELINDIENLEIPETWKPEQVLSFLVRQLKEKEISC
jgi:hypothetical protein